MEPFYSRLYPFYRKLFLSASFFIACLASQSQVYYAHLDGPGEQPPNSSAGVGTALVTISGNMMRLQTTFSGLTGTVTAAHIHAPTPGVASGTAGVATTLPTFPGFPSGVQGGSYDQTFDMTMASSYNPAYITNNGGTATAAFEALKTAIAAGRAYLNIHSNVFPGGEIRGFLFECPSIAVSIPDAWALGQGVEANTVYPPYSPAESLTLQANAMGGAGPYTYSWSNGGTAAETMVSPAVATTYSVTVTDQNGCSGMASKTVNVVDVSGGNKGQNIMVCHKGNSQSLAAAAVAGHLAHGDGLGGCSAGGFSARVGMSSGIGSGFTVKALANPARNYFELQLSGAAGNVMQLRVFDVQGRLVEWKRALQPDQTLRIGGSYHPGIYLVQITQGEQSATLRLIKAN